MRCLGRFWANNSNSPSKEKQAVGRVTPAITASSAKTHLVYPFSGGLALHSHSAKLANNASKPLVNPPCDNPIMLNKLPSAAGGHVDDRGQLFDIGIIGQLLGRVFRLLIGFGDHSGIGIAHMAHFASLHQLRQRFKLGMDGDLRIFLISSGEAFVTHW